MHRRILEIEKYANTDKWVEGTLIEHDSEEVNMDNVMKDLGKMLDLEFFGQVQVPDIGPSSAGNFQQELQENIPSIAVESKGKEKEHEIQVIETFKMTEQPQTSKAQGQVQVPPQTNPVEMPNLQTPLNIEKGKKREAEGPTPPKESSKHPQAKRQKLNPLLEVESFEEIIDIPVTEDSQQTILVSGTCSRHKKDVYRYKSKE